MSDPTHAERLAQIREREQQATAGPWVEEDGILWSDAGMADWSIVDSDHTQTVRSDADRTFIAHARADIPWLLDAIAQRDAQLAQMRAQVKALQTHLCLGRLTGKWFPAVNRDELLALLEPKTP